MMRRVKQLRALKSESSERRQCCYPDAHGSLDRWASENGASREAAERRFIKFCILETVASDSRLSRILILRGSGALQLFYGGLRECDDIDLVVTELDGPPTSGEEPGAPRPTLNRLLGERLPLHFEGRDLWAEWFATIKIQLSEASCVYDFTRMTLSNDPKSLGFGKKINVATLEVLVAEKIAAMANAVERGRLRRREQDVFDLASLWQRGAQLDLPRLRELVRRRAEEHGFAITMKQFDAAGRSFIGLRYEALRSALGAQFLPFDQAWGATLDLVRSVLG
jgi:hypothetical protein